MGELWQMRRGGESQARGLKSSRAEGRLTSAGAGKREGTIGLITLEGAGSAQSALVEQYGGSSLVQVIEYRCS